jgi:hypothetical protein
VTTATANATWTMEKSIIVGNAFLYDKAGKRHYVHFQIPDQKDRILVTTIKGMKPAKLTKGVISMVQEQVKAWTGEEKKVY